MRSISKWASNNVTIARVLILFGFVLAFFSALSIGILLYTLQISLPQNLVYFSLIAYIGLFAISKPYLLLPTNKDEFTKRAQLNGLAVLCFLIISAVGMNNLMFTKTNESDVISSNSINVAKNKYATLVVVQANQNAGKDLDQLKSSEFKWKIESKIAKALKKRLKKMKTNRSITNIGLMQFGFALLLLGVNLVALYFLSILVCNLSCSGYAVASGVAMFGGMAIIICSLFFGIRWIIRWGRKKRAMSDDPLNISLG